MSYKWRGTGGGDKLKLWLVLLFKGLKLYPIKCRRSCSLILGNDSQKLCPVNVQVLSYIMLPHVHTLVKKTNSGGYLGSIIGGEYVAKPPMTLRLYNLKTQGFS